MSQRAYVPGSVCADPRLSAANSVVCSGIPVTGAVPGTVTDAVCHLVDLGSVGHPMVREPRNTIRIGKDPHHQVVGDVRDVAL